MINLLTYSLFALFSLGQLGRVSLFEGSINFYAYEILAGIILLMLLLKHKAQPLKLTYNKIKVIYLFYLFTVVSYTVNIFNYTIEQNSVALLYLLRLFFYPLLALYTYYFFKENKNRSTAITKALNMSFIFIAVTSVLQYFLYPDLRNLYYLGWDPHYNRLFGVFFDTGLAAAMYGVISIYFYRKKKILLSLIFLIFLVLTFSRASYIFYFLTVGLMFIKFKNFKFIFIFLGIFLSVLLLSPKQFGDGVGLTRWFSVISRVEDYKNALKAVQFAPVLGHGYNRIEFVKEKYNLKEEKINDFPQNSAASYSSSFLIMLVTCGMVGLLLFLLSLFKLSSLLNLTPYLMFVSMMSLADNILLHPLMLFMLGSVAVVNLLSDRSP